MYELSLYMMVGVLVVGFIANLLVRPVSERFHMSSTEDEAKPPAETSSPLFGGGAPPARHGALG